MKVSLEGIGERVATFEAETEGSAAVTAGSAVTLCGNGKVRACAETGDVPAGVALSVRNGYAAVQLAGYVKLPCASALTVGWHHLALDAAGGMAETEGGRGALITDVEGGICGAVL